MFNKEQLNVAMNVLLEGKESKEALELKKSININVLQPLRTVIELRLGEASKTIQENKDCENLCIDKILREAVDKIIEDYSKEIGP